MRQNSGSLFKEILYFIFILVGFHWISGISPHRMHLVLWPYSSVDINLNLMNFINISLLVIWIWNTNSVHIFQWKFPNEKKNQTKSEPLSIFYNFFNGCKTRATFIKTPHLILQIPEWIIPTWRMAFIIFGTSKTRHVSSFFYIAVWIHLIVHLDETKLKSIRGLILRNIQNSHFFFLLPNK